MITSVFRDGQSGKLTVDDYGAKTGRSPGKMRQLNINGPLYVGRCGSQFIIPLCAVDQIIILPLSYMLLYFFP